MHVSLEWEYREHKVKGGVVVYVACEGQAGVPKRLEAFKRHHNVTDSNFYFLLTRLDLIKEAKELIAAIKEQLGDDIPIMIVLDTLNRTLVGSEHKDEDMSAYIGASENIKEAFNCAVVVVHHSGVDATRPRGHTSLAGAVDAQIAITRPKGSDTTVATVEWMKDGEEGEKIASKFITVVVGTDDGGEEITSLILEKTELAATAPTSELKLPPTAKHAFDMFNDLLAKGNVTRAQLREACAASNRLTASENPRVQRSTFDRALRDLIRLQMIAIEGKNVVTFDQSNPFEDPSNSETFDETFHFCFTETGGSGE